MANQVTTFTIGQPGVWLTKARHHYVAAGASAQKGGTGEALLAAELLLAGLTSCATSLITSGAQEAGIALRHVEMTATSERDDARPNHYARITLSVTLTGPTLAQAQALVASFQNECPIYGTLSRGAPLTVNVAVLA
jgi:uncharacterized OsmC-like protein